MNKQPHLASAAILLANSAAIHTLYSLLSDESFPHLVELPIWWCFLLLTYGVLAFFLRKPRSLRGVILICIGAFVLQLALTLLFGVRHTSPLSWIIIVAFWIALYFRCCSLLFHTPKVEQLITAFETTAAVLLFAAFIFSRLEQARTTILSLIFSLLLTLSALARLRTSQARPPAAQAKKRYGSLFPFLSIAAVGAGTALCVFIFSESAFRLFSTFTNLLQKGLVALWAALEQFMKWLVSLLPPADPGEMGSMNGTESSFQVPTQTEELIEKDFVIYFIVGIVFIALILCLVVLWRKGTTHRPYSLQRPLGSWQRKGPSLWAALRRLLQRIAGQITYFYHYLTQFNTPLGLFVWLERQAKKRHMGRHTGETPHAFLLRLGSRFPDCAEDLHTLSDYLDTLFFSPSAMPVNIPAKELRRRLRKSFSNSR